MHDEPKVELDNIGFHSCLCHPSYQDPNIGEYIRLHDAYSKGILPDVGGYLDQSAKTMELISLIDVLKQDQQLAEQERQAKRNKHG